MCKSSGQSIPKLTYYNFTKQIKGEKRSDEIKIKSSLNQISGFRWLN